MPVLCGETAYEGHMQQNFQDVQRHVFWMYMLNGAAGHTYGAAGVWQAGVEGDPGIRPIYDWTTWREWHGAANQIGLGKKLRLNWNILVVAIHSAPGMGGSGLLCRRNPR